MTRDFHAPGRSQVYACNGMAATSHPMASLAAVETLRAGGNAADAAVAAVAMLGVLEPHMTGIGGDCFCLVSKPGEPVWGYNGTGRAAAAMQPERLVAEGMTAIAIESPHAVTVPGAVEAWENILARHGRFGLDKALEPAIAAAQRGVPVSPRVAMDWSVAVEKLRARPNSAALFLHDGKAPSVGDVVRFPALAETLKKIAAEGARAFYEGELAEDSIATLSEVGSFLTADDFAKHRGDEAIPISTTYRGLEVVEIPPNGQGLAALVLLNILENFDLSALDPTGAARQHLAIEAGRLAYAVRNTHIADPSFMVQPVPSLLDRGFATDLADMIDRTRRSNFPAAPAPRGNTVLVCVVDRDRNAVTLINSLFSGFGSGIASAKTGIMFQNRGSGFNLQSGHPNCIGPSKRPLHTIIPAMTLLNGRTDMAFGVMGGAYQAMGHAYFISNVMDFGLDLQAAIDLPRVFFEGEEVIVENGFDESVMQDLRTLGHQPVRRPLPQGGGQAIRIDWDRGVLIGASDPRKDGCALGY